MLQFWVLKPDWRDRWWSLVLSKRADSLGEDVWWEVIEGKRPRSSESAPFRVCDAQTKVSDVMLSVPGSIVFSQRMAALLGSVHCAGFDPQPSLIYDVRDRKLLCSVAKWTQFRDGCGPVDRERGYNVARPYSDPLRDQVGLFFDHATWTGLDIFKPTMHPAVVITDRIAQAIHGGNFKGYVLERVEEYGTDMVRAGKKLQKERRDFEKQYPMLGSRELMRDALHKRRPLSDN